MSDPAADGYVGKFDSFYCVALVDDLPEFDLKKGDIGVILEVYPPNGFTVEFNAEEGRLSALLDLDREWLRIPSKEELKKSRELPPNKAMGEVTRRPRISAPNP